MSTSFQTRLLRLFMKNMAFAVLVVWCFSSCSVTKPGNYFKDIKRDTTITNTAVVPAELKIKKNDVLSVNISSINVLEDEIYNQKPTGGSSDGIAAQSQQVSTDGYISIHSVGKIKVEGLTRKEAVLLVQKKLEPFLKDPIVSIAFANQHVTVIGEISKPQVYSLSDEKITIIDLLALSGSITPITKLTNIMVIRDKDNAKEFRHVNLEDHSIFTSPYYYLQPNDVVVVSQDEKILQQQLRQEKYRQYSTLIFQTLSTAIIIYQAFFRR